MLFQTALFFALLTGGQAATQAEAHPRDPRPAGARPDRILLTADLDGDGRTDLVLAGRDTPPRVLLQEANGSFREGFGVGIEPLAAVSLLDLDRDGHVDLHGVASSGRARLFLNDGSGRLVKDDRTEAPVLDAVPHAATWLDLDADGDVDVLYETDGGSHVFVNTGGLRFRSAGRFPHAVSSPHGPDATTTRPSPPIAALPADPDGDASASTPPASGTVGDTPSSSGGGRAVVVGTTGPSAGAGGSSIVADAIRDQAAPGTSLAASSTPTEGALYPLGSDFFVDSPVGRIGFGTTAPATRLHVQALDPTIRLEDTDDLGSYSELADSPLSLTLAKSRASGSAVVALNPMPVDATSDAFVRVFRGTATGGTRAMRFFRGDGTSTVASQVGVGGADTYFNAAAGSVGIGTDAPSEKLHVQAVSARIRVDESGDTASWSTLEDLDAQTLKLKKVTSSGNSFVDLSPLAQDGSSNASVRFFRDTSTSGSRRVQVLRGDGTATVDAQLGSGTDDTFFANGGGNVGIGITNPSVKLDVAGTTRTEVLTITGGSDLVEPFPSTGVALEPGMVVSIDPDRIGHLRASDSARDTRVAGVVSGAGGVNPGICMSQEGVLEGDVLVAMTGRVYVQASAENGPIRPGDRLTSSSILGHAMRVAPGESCDGAVLGKAMSSLEEGRGLVLVLVNLQ